MLIFQGLRARRRHTDYTGPSKDTTLPVGEKKSDSWGFFQNFFRPGTSNWVEFTGWLAVVTGPHAGSTGIEGVL